MTDDNEQPLHKTKAAKFIKRFGELRDQSAKLDYELAGLAQEIRQEFPTGASGDSQTRLWMCNYLGIYGQTAAMMIRAARAFTLFPTEEEWSKLGGWSSLGFLLGFKAADRRKIAKHALAIAEERGRYVGYSTVRNLAHALGCQQNRVTGRPNRTQVEENLGILRAFLNEAIQEGYFADGDIPDAVTTALKPTRLSALQDALS